jgi:hypothetical protein
MTTFWLKVTGSDLGQGDYLTNCYIPQFNPDFGAVQGGEEEVMVAKADLIIVTQSCDLANKNIQFVALCPIHQLIFFEEVNPKFKKKGEWEQVRKGRHEGLHLLASPIHPENSYDARVVDFRQIHSLPYTYLAQHADRVAPRWRLASPYLEHFSQAFARFFMRVGLPSSIPAFR